jgi:carotenoid cleavage dioxygenase
VDRSTIPQLCGRFEPVARQIRADYLPVDGTLPPDLAGMYLRNGPNPKFTPLGSYTYPLEGDAMVHGLWIEGGKARYANRWVRTKGMAAEERAGHSLYGGLMTPAFVDMALLGPDPDPGWPFRLDPFVNVVRHAGRYLALEEGTPPYEITADLDTIGLFDFGGKLPSGLCAHPKIDPVTGEMVVFRYDVEAPFLT